MDSKNTQEVLDLSFYRMAKDAYKSDKGLRNEITVNNANDDTLQTWKVRETFHDKQNGMNAVVFERGRWEKASYGSFPRKRRG